MVLFSSVGKVTGWNFKIPSGDCGIWIRGPALRIDILQKSSSNLFRELVKTRSLQLVQLHCAV
jgi:hypothetical protein